jgi:8-oxo-dGTP pyrophosphatase MutT (NUDIX family)
MTLAHRVRRRFEETADLPPIATRDDVPMDGVVAPVPAAVLVAIVDRPEPTLLLTRRDDNLRTHAGQVAFPGGRADREDDGPVATALREAEEEIALPPSAVEVIGCDAPFRTRTNYRIVPVLGIVPPDLALRPREVEVADIFEVPLAHLLDPLNRMEQEMEFEGGMRRYWEFLGLRHRIWGVTAALIVNLARRIGDG